MRLLRGGLPALARPRAGLPAPTSAAFRNDRGKVELTREQKIQFLNHWRLDASRLEGSEGEGMGGEDAPMLHRVHKALAALMGQQ